MTVVDLGAAPGGWSEYAVKKVGDSGQVVASTLLLFSLSSLFDLIQA